MYPIISNEQILSLHGVLNKMILIPEISGCLLTKIIDFKTVEEETVSGIFKKKVKKQHRLISITLEFNPRNTDEWITKTYNDLNRHYGALVGWANLIDLGKYKECWEDLEKQINASVFKY